MLVSWNPPATLPVGARYLVELRGADGAVRSRMVTGTSITVTGLVRGQLYTGSITTVMDSRRSAAVPVGGAVWVPTSTTASGPVTVPKAAPSSPASAAAAAPHTAAPSLADSPTRHTLVSSPIAAAGLAGLAVVLGGSAIGLLLRRPRASAAASVTQAGRLARAPHR
ncbi:MAG TPA: hypothetical protein VGO26_00385 [Amnibacterium sp.]|nr:hypothetical protein [Amnibacterium sp.]